MERPKEMLSKIRETNSGIIISTPKKKSWILIIFLSLIAVQFTKGIVQSLFFASNLPLNGRIMILILSLTIVYFTLKAILWQLNGIRQIIIGSDNLKIIKLSPLWTKTKTYKLSEIKTIDIKDESVAEGPTAMLQLLSITDKIKIIMTYGYETITINSGMNMKETVEIKSIIKNKIGLN